MEFFFVKILFWKKFIHGRLQVFFTAPYGNSTFLKNQMQTRAHRFFIVLSKRIAAVQSNTSRAWNKSGKGARWDQSTKPTPARSKMFRRIKGHRRGKATRWSLGQSRACRRGKRLSLGSRRIICISRDIYVGKGCGLGRENLARRKPTDSCRRLTFLRANYKLLAKK